MSSGSSVLDADAEPAGGLFLIVPPDPPADVAAVLGEILAVPGCVGVLLRGAPTSGTVAAVGAVCAERQVAFFLERPQDAVRLGADGVVMAAPEEVAAARSQMGSGRLLGVACDLSRHEAMEAGEAGADFIAFGDLTRPISDPLLDLLGWWQELFVLPSLALARIEQDDDAATLRGAGADFIAITLDMLEAADRPGSAMQRLSDLDRQG